MAKETSKSTEKAITEIDQNLAIVQKENRQKSAGISEIDQTNLAIVQKENRLFEETFLSPVRSAMQNNLQNSIPKYVYQSRKRRTLLNRMKAVRNAKKTETTIDIVDKLCFHCSNVIVHDQCDQCDFSAQISEKQCSYCNNIIVHDQCDQCDFSAHFDNVTLRQCNTSTKFDNSKVRIENRKLKLKLLKYKQSVEVLEQQNANLRSQYDKFKQQYRHAHALSYECNKCESFEQELRALKSKAAKIEIQLKSQKTYVHKPYKSVTDAHSDSVRRRCRTLEELILQLSGIASDQRCEVKSAECARLVGEYLKRNTSVTVQLRQSDVKGLGKRLTPEEDLALWAAAGLTWRQRKYIVKVLHKHGVNVLAPTWAFEILRRKAQMQTELIFCCIDLKEGPTQVKNKACIKVQSIRSALIQKVRELKQAGQLLQTAQFNGKIWVCIGGDKGGTSTKLVASIVNARVPNSVRNLIVIGMYYGSDNADNLRTAFSDFTAELENFRTIPVPDTADADSAIQEVPVELFLTGDTMFISHVLGQQGPNANFPCPFCLVTKTTLKTANKWNEKETFTERTVDLYDSDADKIDQKNCITHSVTLPLLFRVPISNICPPQLHIALGVVTAIFKSLKLTCWNIDKQAIGLNDNDDPTKQLKEQTEKVKQKELEITERAKQLKHAIALHKSFVSIGKKYKAPKLCCSAIVCLPETSRCVSDRSNDWIQCDVCGEWFHFACEGISTLQEIVKVSEKKKKYDCQKCTGFTSIADMIKVCEVKVKVSEDILPSAQNELQQLKEKLTEFEDIVLRDQGPCAKRLAIALKSLRIEVQAYHSSTFVGNHVRKMVTGIGPATLASALGNAPANKYESDKYEMLLTSFGKIEDFFVARFLTDSEVDQLESCCSQFFIAFKQLLPDHSIMPKIHFITHLPTFAKKHRTLGLLSEQPQESLHAKMNAKERQYAAVPDTERRMRLMLQHHYVTSTAVLFSEANIT